MPRHEPASWWQGDGKISADDVAYMRSFPGLSRKELTYTLCEHLDWLTPAGRPKFTACAKLLVRLEEAGELCLPSIQKHNSHPGRVRRGLRAPKPLHRHLSRAPSRSWIQCNCDG
jgi:hypothetical protein